MQGGRLRMGWNCVKARPLSTLFGLLFSLWLAAAGAEEVVSTPSPEVEATAERQARQQRLMELSCRDEDERPQGWLDSTHSYLSQRLCEPAAWFDGFFGDPRTLEENPVGSFFRVRNAAHWDEHHGWGYRASVRANLILPQLSERVRLLVARDEDLDGDYPDTGSFDSLEDSTRLGLRFRASERGRSRFDVDGTIRLKAKALNPRLGGRFTHMRGLSEGSLARWTQMAFWEREQGFGTTSRLDLEWLPDRDRLIRFSNRGTWSQKSQGVDWRSSLVAFRQLDLRSALRYEVGAFGRTHPHFESEEYFASVRYRRQFLRHWLYYEVQPEHAWPMDFDQGIRRRDWRLTFTLEIQFENQRSRRQRLDRYLEEDVVDYERWKDEPIPVDAPGDRVEDELLEGRKARKNEAGKRTD